jgi:predicted NBD/HSP70 family sugar kinase
MTEHLQVGIDIGGSKMLLLALAEPLRMRIDGDRQIRDRIATGKDFSAADVQAEIERFVRTLPTLPRSIGIAIPGLVDRHGVVIACDVLPELVGWQPARALSSICGVYALNDAEAALVQVVADLQPQKVIAVVMVGTGIGAAIWINGTIFRGASGWAGELGSMPMGDGRTLDECASGAAILRELGVSVEVLDGMVAGGEIVALETIEQAGSALGMGLATLINLLNPDVIVLAGGTLRWRGYLEAAFQSAQKYSLPDLWAACQMQTSPHGSDLVALGAARISGRIDRD